MTYYTASLSLFLNVVSTGSIGSVERQMEKAGGDIEEIRIAVNGIRARLSLIGNRDSILTTYEDDDKAVWKEFWKELYEEGLSSAIIEQHQPLIKDYIRELANGGLLYDETSRGLGEISEEAGTLTNIESSKRTWRRRTFQWCQVKLHIYVSAFSSTKVSRSILLPIWILKPLHQC